MAYHNNPKWKRIFGKTREEVKRSLGVPRKMHPSNVSCFLCDEFLYVSRTGGVWCYGKRHEDPLRVSGGNRG